MYTDSSARLGLLMSDGTYRYFGLSAAPRLEITWFYGDGQWVFDNLMVLPIFWADDPQGEPRPALDEVQFFDHGNLMPFEISYSFSYDEVGNTWTLNIFGQTIEGIVPGDSNCIIDVSSVYYVR